MADVMLNHLNKLLLQIVFELQQASYSKEHLRQQIQIYAANTAEKKIEICQLQEEINKNAEAIAILRKRNSSCRENCNVWKPTYMILSQHEENLQKELQNHQESTEKDKKMYQDYATQYQETFKQHQEKYLATPIAQEYLQEKNEFEEIQKRVLKQSELLKQKEAEVIELREPGPFQSLSQWALQIASLRHNTKEILTRAVVLRQQSLELEKTAEELQKKINYFKQLFSSFSLFKESHHVLKEKHQMYESLQLPSICQKLVRSFSTLKPLVQQTQRGMEERKDFAGHSAVTSIYFSHVENERQICNDTIGTNIAKNAQLSSVTSLQNQTPLRLLSYQKQTNNRQWFEAEAEAAEIGTFKRDEQATTDCHFAEREDDAVSFPRTPEPNILPKTPASSRVETPLELTPSKSEGSMSKSPAFPFLSSFTAKSPGFNFFDSSVLGAETSPGHQLGESYSGNLNPISSHKDIGNLFGKMENDDSFAFSFPSCSSTQAFQNGKDDFSFPFAFGSSQAASLKGFQSTPQSRKSFSLF
ncbi:protein SIX6OS1 [Zootoca vivipara]|uniref:protein SIX6OS1 n=1 Tax=Zootoca vivipara TaxID=8524 RepID=UPI00293B88FB|nr:protein SIX6OS1 [Zootoca vivipara]